eukprot:5377593-Amphidinium_carterae.1
MRSGFNRLSNVQHHDSTDMLCIHPWQLPLTIFYGGATHIACPAAAAVAAVVVAVVAAAAAAAVAVAAAAAAHKAGTMLADCLSQALDQAKMEQCLPIASL